MVGNSQKLLDMYNMIGFCSIRTIKQQAKFALRNLADASDQEVIDMEQKFIDFVSREVVKMPAKKRHGIVLGSGSEANEIAILLARELTKRKIVIASNICHSSIDNTCKKLGLKLVKVDVNKLNYKVASSNLEKVIKKYADDIALINVTYGTTKFGTGEDIEHTREIERLIQKYKIRIHVDAAYGGFILNLLDENNEKNIWKKSQGFGSMTVDPHKFVGVLGCGLLLLVDKPSNGHLGTNPVYFEGNYSSLGTTRSAFAMATAVLTCSELGIEGLKRLAKKCHKDAKVINAKILELGMQTFTNIESGVIPIRLETESQLNTLVASLYDQGFKVSPIIVNFENSNPVYGIRIVVTPHKDRKTANLLRFVDELKQLI